MNLLEPFTSSSRMWPLWSSSHCKYDQTVQSHLSGSTQGSHQWKQSVCSCVTNPLPGHCYYLLLPSLIPIFLAILLNNQQHWRQYPYTRGLEHGKDLENESEKGPLWKHCSIQHGGRKVYFKMDALRSFKFPMVRQVNEGARVRLQKADICIIPRVNFPSQE